MMTDNQKKQIKALRQSGLGYKKVAQEISEDIAQIEGKHGIQINNPFAQILLEKQPMLASPRPPSIAQLQRDAGYHKAQQLLLNMLDSGLISLSEYNKITLLNRQTFSPYLVEIMADITG